MPHVLALLQDVNLVGAIQGFRMRENANRKSLTLARTLPLTSKATWHNGQRGMLRLWGHENFVY